MKVCYSVKKKHSNLEKYGNNSQREKTDFFLRIGAIGKSESEQVKYKSLKHWDIFPRAHDVRFAYYEAFELINK